MEKKLINPNKIMGWDLPLIVLSSHSWGFINWIIKWRTKSSYNHAMIMVHPGKFVSQGWLLKEVPMFKYLKKGSRLKFWKIKDLTKEERAAINRAVDSDLRLPWWKRRYDVLGIFGQALGIRKLNNPWTRYCSESARKYLSLIIKGLPLHQNPGELNQAFKKHERMECYGYFFMD